MSKTLDDYIKKLPPYIGKEIFKFIIYDWHNIIFYHIFNFANFNYSPRYTVARINDEFIKNSRGTILSRIAKQNGKHRYYLTNEIETVYCNGCGTEHSLRSCRGCRGDLYYEYYYINYYVGKDLDKALLELYLENK